MAKNKKIDEGLSLFEIDLNGDLVPNSLLYPENQTKGIQNENTNLSKLEILRAESQSSNISSTSRLLVEQENRNLSHQNHREVDNKLSQHDSSSFGFGISNTSNSTNGNGTKDITGRTSRNDEERGLDGLGYSETNGGEFGLFHQRQSDSLHTTIQSSNTRGFENANTNGRTKQILERESDRQHDLQNRRQDLFGSRQNYEISTRSGIEARDSTNTNPNRQGATTSATSSKTSQDSSNEYNNRTGTSQEYGELGGKMGELSSSRENQSKITSKNDFVARDEVFIGGQKERFDKNINAIKTLKLLEQEDRLPTQQEQLILNHYSGWGGIPQVFDLENDRWRKEAGILVGNLNTDEYNAAKLSTLDAFYTPKIVIDSIYKGLNQLGFNNDLNPKDIFEPSVGIGAFLSYAKNYSKNYNFTCTELDNISSRIFKKLYPSQKIYNIGFEQHLFDRKFDAFIGNPPFGQKKILDLNDPYLNNKSVHNYFIGNSIKHLKEDGILAFVISSYFLDSSFDSIREDLFKDTTFLGALRLPNNIFKSRANTEVTTDIIFLQKGKNPDIDKKWLKSVEYFDDRFKEAEKRGLNPRLFNNFRINEYFKDNPQNILGKMDIQRTQYGNSLECIDDEKDLEREINRFISELPKDVYKYHKTEIITSFYTLNPESPNYNNYYNKLKHLKDGNYFIYENKVFMRMKVYPNNEIFLKKPELNEHDERRIKKLVELRDEFNELINLEKSKESNDSEILLQRKKLNNIYDNFVKVEGLLNKEANKRAFVEDVESNKILALEKNYNKGISKTLAQKQGVAPKEPSADKADIFFKRTIMPKQEFIINTPKEALLASISEYGILKLSFLEKNLNMSLEKSLQSLIDDKLIFKDHNNSSNYIIAQKYLSGNVKAKYKKVKELVLEHNRQDLLGNLESLKEVLPKDLKASEISVSFGTFWIPTKYYCQFIEEKLEITSEDFEIIKNEMSGGWHFNANDYVINQRIKNQYGTTRKKVSDIVLHALQQKPIVVYDKNITYNDEGKETTKEILNPKETAIAISKVEKIKLDFSDWIYRDYDRRIELEKIYNDTFNTNRDIQYDGSHLILENFNSNIQLKNHQKNAIFRAIQENIIILDHQVGAGKTLTSICAVMEQKRMGLIHKPLIVVPNHILNQWANEFYNAYPNANILLATKKDLEKNNREQFFAKIATNDFDAIIMTHSQFGLLNNPYEQTKKIQEEEIQILEESLRNKKDSEFARYSVKNIEKRLENERVKLENLLNTKRKSKNIDFSEMGIDMLVIDEAHEFKNLRFVTCKDRVSGLGNQKGSQKAFNLYCKTQFIHDTKAKLMFLTGTPISNSIVELYTIQKYTQPNALKEKGIDSFDSWASTFGEISSAWELDSSGINYKVVSRFNKFKNVPELSSLYKNVADTVTNSDIMKFQKNFVPKLYNNKPINIITPRSDEVALFIGVQNEYGSWNEGSIIWRMENQSEDIAKNNLLACTTDARKAGLDFRLINPYAKDYEDSKVNILAQNVYEEWKNWEEDKGTQLIFCDLSTPKIHSQNIETNEINNETLSDDFININDELAIDEEDKNMSATNLDEILAKQSKFDVYSDILKKLKNLGIPQHEIRFIHDAKTDLQKAELFADVNSGKVRILIGSTQKMGAGTNVQERIVAIHHLDCPWRPSDLEQRNGRVIRQGNKLFLRNPEDFRIKEFRYATERTYDARMWQVIESKALSIEQFRKADKNTRELEDISSAAADAAEMKAQATGNPLILMQVQLSSDLKQEEILYNSFKKEQFYNEELLKQSKSYIDLYTKEKKILEDIKDTINNHKSEHFSGKFYDYNLDSNEYKTIDFIIRKNDDSPTNKQNQERIKEFLKKGIEIAHRNFATEYKLFEYRGITISLEKTQIDTLNFYINTPKGDFIEPENLVFKNKNSFIDFSNIITLGGLVTRINNFYNGIEERISTTDRKISKLCSEIIALEKITGENAKPYKRYDYLLALREDEKTIMLEIEKMSKSRSYKSNFILKSQLILKSMDKNEHLECKKEINDINI